LVIWFNVIVHFLLIPLQVQVILKYTDCLLLVTLLPPVD